MWPYAQARKRNNLNALKMAKNQWRVNPLMEAMQKSKRKMKNDVREFLFNSCSIVHHEYAPEGQTINKEYYLEVDFVQL